jgi:chromosome segregation ATPase
LSNLSKGFKMAPDNITEIKVDVGVLKAQITTITTLCQKMDTIIEKIVEQQERYNTQIYQEMETRRQEKNYELKEVHDRIDTVIDKVQLTEHKIMEEIRDLRVQIATNAKKDQDYLDKLNQWKWAVAGGTIVVGWLISHLDFDIIAKMLK